MAKTEEGISAWLSRQPRAVFTLWAIAAAFTAYGCMYAFRKPFSVAKFTGFTAAGYDYKALATVAQIIGYTLSKFLGIKFVTEVRPARRIALIAMLIAIAEGALLLFAVLPKPWNLAGLFLNGLPLGMVWGLIFSFLEGRRVTELLGLGLSVSVIFASGWVKSTGAWTMSAWGVGEFWMPLVTGALFVPLLALALWMLAQLPPPDSADIALRTQRVPMDRKARHSFLHAHWLGIALLVGAYLLLMVYRDLRDTFMVNILSERGAAIAAGDFAGIEDLVGLAVIALLCGLVFFRNNRAALLANAALVSFGALLLGAATWLHTHGQLSPRAWIIITGIGLYAGFVPLQSIFFERVLAVLRTPATAVFLIALGDSYGYLSTITLYLVKTFTSAKLPWSSLLIGGSYVLAVLVPLCTIAGVRHFLRPRDRHKIEPQSQPSPVFQGDVA